MTLPLILGNRALVEMEGANVTERGGIIISPVASETRGKIVALGDGDKIPTMLKTAVGEQRTVIVGRHTAYPVEIDGKKYQLMSVEDIYAVEQ